MQTVVLRRNMEFNLFISRRVMHLGQVYYVILNNIVGHLLSHFYGCYLVF